MIFRFILWIALIITLSGAHGDYVNDRMVQSLFDMDIAIIILAFIGLSKLRSMVCAVNDRIADLERVLLRA
jgi:4-hydroxybenzoate polyprenyltransferase